MYPSAFSRFGAVTAITTSQLPIKQMFISPSSYMPLLVSVTALQCLLLSGIQTEEQSYLGLSIPISEGKENAKLSNGS